MGITQAEADFLLRVEKVFDDVHESLLLGPAPQKWTRKLTGVSNKEAFLLDYSRRSIEVMKYTLNHRYRQTVILLRYDATGRHTNPDGVTFDGPHVHLYREGFGDKFAYPASVIGVEDGDALETVFEKVLLYCNIARGPQIELSIF